MKARTNPFPVGDMHHPVQPGMRTGLFWIRDMDLPLSSWGYGLPLFGWEYGLAPFQLVR